MSPLLTIRLTKTDLFVHDFMRSVWHVFVFSLIVMALLFGAITGAKAAPLAEIGPAVTGVSSTVANGPYGVGEIIPITVTFDVPVNVTGTPQLELETGGTDRIVNYTSGSGTTTLTFTYTVQSGDYSLDLVYTNWLALTLNGGTIVDASTSDPANLVLPVPGVTGSLNVNKNIIIDNGNTPTVTSVTSTVANNTYTLGALIPITVTFSEAVNVTGTPQLTLETGTTDQVVNFSSGSGTTTLTFNYTVQTGDINLDLDYLNTSALALNGGTIQDGVSNTAILSLTTPGAAGSLSANKDIAIVWDAAQITGVSSTNGSYGLGALIPITVTFSEAVNVTGTPQLTLETGTTDRVVNYSSGSGTTNLIFNYTVQAGDEAVDLDYIDINALSLNGGTIQNFSASNVSLTLPTPSTSGSLSANNNIVVDAVAPETAIETTPANPVASANATFTFSGIDNILSEELLTFECRLDGGSFSACVTPQNYTGLADGSHTFETRAADALNNIDATPASFTWVIDTTNPVININQPNTSPAISKTITASVLDSTPTTLTMSNTTGSICNASLTFIPYASQMFTSEANNGTKVCYKALDSLGQTTYNLSNAISGIDTTAPTVMLEQTLTQADPTSSSPINFTVAFSESVTGFSSVDITLGGTANPTTALVTGSGMSYNVAVSGMTGSGTVIASINANVAQDLATNNNLASTSVDNVVTFNFLPPTVTINQAASQADPTSSSPIRFTAVFSEGVSGFTGSDISFSGTTLAGTLVATVSEIAPLNGTTYDVAVTGMIPVGTVFVSIPAGVVNSVSRPTFTNLASTSTDNNVTFDHVLVEFASLATKDGWLLESTESSNAGGSLDASSSMMYLGDNANDRQYRSLLHFNTASLPNNAIIYGATLRIIQAGVVGTNPFTTHGLLRAEIKNGFFGTSNALANQDFQATANQLGCTFDPVAIFIESLRRPAYRCVVSTAAFANISLTGSTQFRLRFTRDDNDDRSDDIFKFYSGNFSNLSQKPRLFIKYYLP